MFFAFVKKMNVPRWITSKLPAITPVVLLIVIAFKDNLIVCNEIDWSGRLPTSASWTLPGKFNGLVATIFA